MEKLSIYIHIPFCNHSKCKYCSFVSFCTQDGRAMDDYVLSLIREIETRGKSFFKTHEVATIFFGGGTPSVLPAKKLGEILAKIRENFAVLPTAEISLEANPDTITREKLQTYRSFGVNRISIGAQSMNDSVLKIIGRQHTSQQFSRALKLAKDAGFTNINVDMMIGLPEQTKGDTLDFAQFLVRQNVPHISCYSLILEKGTALYKDVKAFSVKIPSDDDTVKMYDGVYKFLKTHGYARYEVSNFAQENFECSHNWAYWTGGEYLGLGVAAHSFLGDVRSENTADLKEYLQAINAGKTPTAKLEKLTLEMKREEYIMLRLRTNVGINLAEFKENFSYDLLNEKQNEIKILSKNSLIEIQNNRLFATDKGFHVLNSVIMKLI